MFLLQCTIMENANKKSFGSMFNSNGGGVYAMQRTSTAIKMWFCEHSLPPSSLTKRS